MSINPDEQSRSGSQWRSLLLVVGLAILLRWGLIEPRWIPSESMQPGLQPQDRMVPDTNKEVPLVTCFRRYKSSPKKE